MYLTVIYFCTLLYCLCYSHCHFHIIVIIIASVSKQFSFVFVLFSDNPKQTTRATVYILILDVNDNAPQFAMFYDTFVCENARPGQVTKIVKNTKVEKI